MPRLVLLPGLACDERLWEAQLPVLPAAMRPVVSEAHRDRATIEAMASTVLESFEGPLVACGASMGGMIAMEMVRQAPERIAGLALLGTNARPETPDMFKLRESAIGLFERGEARDVIQLNAGFAFHPAQAADAGLVRRYVEMILDGGIETLISQNRAVMQRPDARLHLAEVRCPVLVMCGDSDQLTPPECSREIADALPSPELVWVPQCGHMLTMEQPGFVNTILSGWLERQSQCNWPPASRTS